MKKQLVAVSMAILMSVFLIGCNKEHLPDIVKKEAEPKDLFVEIDYFWNSTLGCRVQVVYEVHSGVVYYVPQDKFHSGITEAHSNKDPNKPMLKDEYLEIYGSSKK